MSARFQHSRTFCSWLTIGLLGIAMAGCQSAAIRGSSRFSAANRDVTIDLVSEVSKPVTAAKKPEAWQLQKTQRDAAVRQAAAESKSKGSVTRASFESKLWQSDEPTPFVTCESSLCPTCPCPDDEIECPSHCKEVCFQCDLDYALPTLWCDAKGVLNWNNALILTAAGGAAYAMREGDIDREVRESVANHPNRWGNGGQFLGKLGDAEYQVPILLGVYGYSLWSQDDDLHEVMGSTLSAVTITGVSVTALKFATNTDRPSTTWSNGHYGFPSYHTASTFAIAAVLDEYYGCKVGLPAYLLAGAVGFSRLDQQAHDMSDVFFGGALGFVVGKAVAGRHLCGNSKIQFIPYFHPTDGSPGVGGEVKF